MYTALHRGIAVYTQAMSVLPHRPLARVESPSTPDKTLRILSQVIALRLRKIRNLPNQKKSGTLFLLSVPLLKAISVIQFYKSGAFLLGSFLSKPFSNSISSFKFKSVLTFFQALSISLSAFLTS